MQREVCQSSNDILIKQVFFFFLAKLKLNVGAKDSKWEVKKLNNWPD